MLTTEQLKKISPATSLMRIDQFIHHLNAYMPQYGIDTPVEIASFLAQVLHESGGLKWLREIWGPTSAQSRYEGRADLGNTVKGDGKKFMGRGLIQLTGRANYLKMSKEMFGDDRLIHTPDLLSTAEYAVKSACIYWKWRKMDLIDDDMDIRAETKKVNGGANGLADRQQYFNRAISVLQS
jgi:putative chitinase